jgi:hypothetical protein
LLGLLFEAVFTGLNLSRSGHANSPKVFWPIVVHEDDYFVPKNDCPLVSFETACADSPVTFKSLRHGSVSQYYFRQQGDISTIDGFNTVPEKSRVCRVTGPNTDCWEVINDSALIEAAF